jgi:hypothetical protein
MTRNLCTALSFVRALKYPDGILRACLNTTLGSNAITILSLLYIKIIILTHVPHASFLRRFIPTSYRGCLSALQVPPSVLHPSPSEWS